ncbi:MAG: type I-U CRISPR-associated protein Cas5/Cas6, partial [Bacteroidetes bacterium]
LLRAFIAVWRRKLDPAGCQRHAVHDLLAALSRQAPAYRLPPAVAVHSRHYMPVREGRQEKPVLVFDAALRIPRDEPLRVHWPVALDEAQQELLARLVENLGYLGRAESWVALDLEPAAPETEFECRPLREGESLLDTDTGEVLGEQIELLVPRTPEDYQQFREGVLAGLEHGRATAQSCIDRTLPEDWLDALAVETADLRRAGWSAPPAARRLAYLLPADARRSRTAPRAAAAPAPRPQCVRYCLAAHPLPELEDTVQVAEWARAGAMGRGRYLLGHDELPWQISGHDNPGDNHHGHAFWLPEDADGDGRIDHLLVVVPAGLDRDSEAILRSLSYLRDRDGRRLQLQFEGLGDPSLLAAVTPLLGESRVWRSVTPYLYTHHLKIRKHLPPAERAARARSQIEDQLRRECRQRGLPEPEAITWLKEIPVGGRPRRAIHFRRFRSKRGLTQPDRLGRLLQLRFPEPVSGPLALGFGCHFGLGLFRRVEEGP